MKVAEDCEEICLLPHLFLRRKQMVIVDFIFALFFAIIALIILMTAIGWRRPVSPMSDAIFLFILFLLLIWAGGIWITPFGPALVGGYWLPFFFMAVIFILLLAAVVPEEVRRAERKGQEQLETEEVAATVFGIFFWILVIFLIAAIIARYVWFR